ncbi:unnamed protein product [Linum trigynum]|uniref:Uncharacterized protein n=1 Tax=Linum trigynum TaxID=586398 RepID=A0AAV2G5G5_9ROSI
MPDINGNDSSPNVYLCTETWTKCCLPGNPDYFGEEMFDTRDLTFLWLPGGVIAYVDVNKASFALVLACWYSNEDTNLVMLSDYELDGNLRSPLHRRSSD